MKRVLTALVLIVLGVTLVALPGCKKQMVTVKTGEIVLCTYGETVSDTTEELDVPAGEVGKHGVTTKIVTCDLHQKLEALYEAGEKALAEGDEKAAERAFAEIAEADSTFRDAAAKLAALKGGKGDEGSKGSSPGAGAGESGGTSPGQGQGSTTPSTPGEDSGPVGPIANLTNYIPDRLPGFVGQRVFSDPFVLFRDYLPESRGRMVQMAVEVEQFKDNAAARHNVDIRVRARYDSNGQNIKIGSLEGYFGTRQNFAGLAFTEGPVFVLMEVYTTSSNPAEHRDAMVAAAKVMAGQ
ncbi:MAG: hypothetical protein RBS78_08160 [Coriobacteriia bacterium]|jgi:hypothetical protein|nr:hypothetical protein [Coriobacteriia bacterium]